MNARFKFLVTALGVVALASAATPGFAKGGAGRGSANTSPPAAPYTYVPPAVTYTPPAYTYTPPGAPAPAQ